MPRSLLQPGFAAAAIREVTLERRVMLAWQVDSDSDVIATLRESALGHAWPGGTTATVHRLAFAR